MLEVALQSYVDGNADLAEAVCRRDEEADNLYEVIYDELNLLLTGSRRFESRATSNPISFDRPSLSGLLTMPPISVKRRSSYTPVSGSSTEKESGVRPARLGSGKTRNPKLLTNHQLAGIQGRIIPEDGEQGNIIFGC